YSFDAAAHTLSGRRKNNVFRLGDTLRVAVAHVDVDRRELDFRLVQRSGRKNPISKKSKAPRKTERRGRSDGGTKRSKKSTKQRTTKKSRRKRR
ncbi:MAG: ribonuclease R, partial [Planctomycetota bacterium]|nr:ribonuclease R [Planctomycetota bacterium]